MLFPSAPFPVCTRLFVILVCFASQTTVLCSAFSFGSLSPFAHVYLLCWCASPRKQRVCVVLFPSAPFPVCTRFFVILVCFASQTTGLCSAFSFGSLSPFAHVCLLCWCASPRKLRVCVVLFPSAPFLVFCTRLFVMLVCFASPLLHRLVCFVNVSRLANSGLALCCFVGTFGCVRFYTLFVLYSEFCLAYFALQTSGLRNAFTPSP